MSFSVMVFAGYMPNSGTAGSHGIFIPSFFFKEFAYCSLVTYSFLLLANYLY